MKLKRTDQSNQQTDSSRHEWVYHHLIKKVCIAVAVLKYRILVKMFFDPPTRSTRRYNHKRPFCFFSRTFSVHGCDTRHILLSLFFLHIIFRSRVPPYDNWAVDISTSKLYQPIKEGGIAASPTTTCVTRRFYVYVTIVNQNFIFIIIRQLSLVEMINPFFHDHDANLRVPLSSVTAWQQRFNVWLLAT